MSVIVLLVVIYVGLYVVLSIPSVQNKVRERVCTEMSGLLGGELGIRHLTVNPFSEVILTDITLDSPDGERCARVGKVAAGIDLWTLFSERKIVLNYAEIIGLDVKVVQDTKGSPFNIQFLIDALSPKDKDKPSTVFDLRIRNVVVRDSKASLRCQWMTEESGIMRRLANVDIEGLRMDLSIPVLSNDLYRFDVRNIQFDATPGVSVRSLSTSVSYVKDPGSSGYDQITVRDFNIAFPHSYIAVGDFDIKPDSIVDINAIVKGQLTPSDFSVLAPCLESFEMSWNISIDALLKDKNFVVSEFMLEEPGSNSSISIRGDVKDINRKDSLDISVDELNVDLSPKLITDISVLVPRLGEKGKQIIQSSGRIALELEGGLKSGSMADAQGIVSTDIGNIDFTASVKNLQSRRPSIRLLADTDGIDLGRLLGSDRMGRISLNLETDVTGIDKNAEGSVLLRSDEFMVMGNQITGLDLKLNKIKDTIDLMLDVSSKDMNLSVDGNTLLAGSDSRLEAEMSISGLRPSSYGVKGKMADCDISARLKAATHGDNADNLTGMICMSDLRVSNPNGKKLNLSELSITVDTLLSESSSYERDTDKSLRREVKLNSEWLDAYVSGSIHPSSMVKELKRMAESVFPTLLSVSDKIEANRRAENDFTFDINVKGATAPYAFFDTPFRPLTDIPIRGSVDAVNGKASLSVTTPHLQQGKNKLIRDIALNLDLDSYSGMAKVNAGLIYPAKKGDAELDADIYAMRDKINVNLGINPTLESAVKGGVALEATFGRIPDVYNKTGELSVQLDILPSTVTVNDKVWVIADGGMFYSGNRISVSNFMINHEDQYVKIFGTASESPDDVVNVRLNDIDLEYIFNLLNINYVSFGGMATGEVIGSRLLTKTPEARTEFLRVNGLSYNGAELGDADLASDYDAQAKKVGIYGVIRDPLTRRRRASVDGGIWVTRDSLSFSFDAQKINVGIMKPFVSAFCSDLYGEASGKCKLYGTFSNIDMTGDLKADTLSMKLDFTNTWYHAGNDSVFLSNGVIEIPPLTLYDDEGHTAEFSGWLRHRYFHDPVFNFRLKDAESLLCYDTNEKINPLWYGTIYGSGHAQITGNPGLIDIDMNMTTEEGSRFYYIISDAEDIAQYSFLTFTDSRKKRLEAEAKDSVPEYLNKFRKQNQEMESGSSNVILSIKGTVTNDALVTLVMDPRAGDNITARGQGALQMDYNLAGNDLRMIGTYVLDEGNYNFTLQDIIIKNFNIRKGSLIKFDGDPMKAVLDITATYRVNTNLTDLDESFSNDKDLNRTNVPVDAVLLVDGPMTNPDITFDIELPSLMSDVERKVKSIVSTNDMMSRQIIYLLALNRFYTPEYTGGGQGSGRGNSGSEWSSLASSTISSQLSNMLSQMTDKLDVSPSFRSDKGDFTDMEFDLALSSRLLNNRLLINGNFGYRDKNTSNTQFVGDFDIEYLLSKNGNLRLKAYNHFNDQNYYLRSALTTQGVGVVFRRDFDRLFRRKKKGDKETPLGDSESETNPEQIEDEYEVGRDSIFTR